MGAGDLLRRLPLRRGESGRIWNGCYRSHCHRFRRALPYHDSKLRLPRLQ